MAQKKLNTRILLRNDLASAWTEANPILAKGEIGIETDTLKFKVGDNKTPWNTLTYANKSIAEIDQAIAENEDKTTIVSPAPGVSDLDAIKNVCKDASKGDIAIVKRLIENSQDKYTHSAYVFDGENWQAADGSYNAENVYLDKDLTITAPIGVQTIDSSGSKKLDTKGKNIKEVLDLLMAKEKDPSITKPSASITLEKAGGYEVGTKITPKYSTSFNAGKYGFGPATGVTAKAYKITGVGVGDEERTVESGTFSEVQLTDDTTISLNLSVAHSAGVNPKTNLGNERPNLKINEGSVSASSASITSYRKYFYGTMSTKPAEISAADIRGLQESSTEAGKIGAKFDVNIPVGAQRVIIAIPEKVGVELTISDVNGLGAAIRSSFTKTTVQVPGANNYGLINYDVYYMDYAQPNDVKNTYGVEMVSK